MCYNSLLSRSYCFFKIAPLPVSVKTTLSPVWFLAPLLLLLSIIAGPPTAAAATRPIQHEPWEYRLGEGLRIDSTEFKLGGYMSFNYVETSGDDGSFNFDDLSLFLFGPITDKLSFFSEQEFTDIYTINTNGSTHAGSDFEIERFFVDYNHSDTVDVKFGKFLTPIGTWNEIHADPLTWTVSRPVVTALSFPEHTTGLLFSGFFTSMEREFSYKVFLQNNESINEDTGEMRTHTMYGARLRWLASPSLEISVPLLHYLEYRRNDRVYMTGLDFTYTKGRLEVRGEGTLAHVQLPSGQGTSREYGYYLQAMVTLTEKLFTVVRHEHFRARGEEGENRSNSFAAAYRFKPQVVLKAEYQLRDGGLVVQSEGIEGRDRFLTSFSILF